MHASRSAFKHLRVSEYLEGRDSTKTFQNFPFWCQNLILLCLQSEPRVSFKSELSHYFHRIPDFSIKSQ